MLNAVRLKSRTSSILWIFLVSLVLLSCKNKVQQETQIQEIPVVTVLQKDVPIYEEFVGQVYGEKDIPIRARVEGLLEGIHFKEGLGVAKGQLLYTIDPKPLEAKVNTQRSKVAEAQTMLVKAKSDLARYKPLAEINAVSQSDLDAAQAEYDATISSLEAAKSNLESAQIELGYTKIYSPINGVIGKTIAKVGDFVGREPNPVILNTVSQINNVKVQFFLTESEYLTIIREVNVSRKKSGTKDGERLEIRKKDNLELILSDGSLYDYKGSIDFVDRGVDATTGSMLVQGNFPNPNSVLRPGLYSKVKIEMEVLEGALLVPQRCLMELQGQYSVYVVSDSNMVEARQVVVGEKLDDYMVISEGLMPNEKIVIDALQKVRTGMQVSPSLIEFESKSTQQ